MTTDRHACSVKTYDKTTYLFYRFDFQFDPYNQIVTVILF